MRILLLVCICVVGCAKPQTTEVRAPRKLPVWEADGEKKYLPVLLEREHEENCVAVNVYFMDGTEMKSVVLRENTKWVGTFKVFIDVPAAEPIWAKTRREVDRSSGQQHRSFHEIHLHDPGEYPVKR